MKYYLFDKISEGEKHYITRKRLLITQMDFCEQTSMSRSQLYNFEYDETEAKEQIFLELWEECKIYMRRYSISPDMLSRDMGVRRSTMYYWRNGEKNYDKLFERLMDDKNNRT